MVGFAGAAATCWIRGGVDGDRVAIAGPPVATAGSLMRTTARFLAPVLALATAVATSACVSSEKPDEEEVPGEDGKDDSFYRPTNHGPIAWSTPAHTVLTKDERHHTWTFELSGDARVDMTTSYSLLGQRRTDTVLYLYREGPTGWGPYIARNDDYGTTIYSQLIRQLGAGRYRVLVKGHLASTRGKFKITVGCQGAGCAPVVADDCVFGATYAELPGLPAIQLSGQHPVTASTSLSELDRRRVVLAVQANHPEVTTLAQAFARADQGTLDRVNLYEPAAARTFLGFAYRAGGKTYGAIFEGRGERIVAQIRDGRYDGTCTVTAETCQLGTAYYELRADPAYQPYRTRVITAVAQLADHERAQVVRAVHEIVPTITTAAEALAQVDGGELNFINAIYRIGNSWSELTTVEYGAGDNSYGAVFYGETLQLATAINDGDFYGCTQFIPKGGVAEGEACRGTGDCEGALQCNAVFAGAGVCISTAPIPGDGNECTSDAACGSAALVCAGATRGYGLCNPAWMRGTFANPGAAIPDGGLLIQRFAVRGLASVDTDVVLRMTITHPRASQLRITLTNPASNEVLIHDGTAADDGQPLAIARPITNGFSGDESVNGEWTLRIADRTSGHAGTLAPWQLTLTSRWD